MFDIFEINNQEVLCRIEKVLDDSRTYPLMRRTPIITRDEFLFAYYTWVRGKKND